MVTGSRKLPSPMPISTLIRVAKVTVADADQHAERITANVGCDQIGDAVPVQVPRDDARRIFSDLDGFVEVKKVGGLVGFAPRAPGPYQQEETGRKTQAHVARTVHKSTILRSRHRWRNQTACVLRRP